MSSMKISSALHVKEGPWARCSWVDYVAPAGVVWWRGIFRLHPNCSCWARLLWYETEARQSPSVHSALTHILSFINQTTICCLWHSPCSHTSPSSSGFLAFFHSRESIMPNNHLSAKIRAFFSKLTGYSRFFQDCFHNIADISNTRHWTELCHLSLKLWKCYSPDKGPSFHSTIYCIIKVKEKIF